MVLAVLALTDISVAACNSLMASLTARIVTGTELPI